MSPSNLRRKSAFENKSMGLYLVIALKKDMTFPIIRPYIVGPVSNLC